VSNPAIGPAVNKDAAGTPRERLFGATQALVATLAYLFTPLFAVKAFLQCGHHRGGNRAMRPRMAWRTAAMWVEAAARWFRQTLSGSEYINL